MRDVFPNETAGGKSAPDFATNDAEASRIRDGLEAQQVCPFCGAVGDGSTTLCPKCAMENNAAARKATKLRIGPWYVLQSRNPAAPGMKWETLLSFIRKGRVKPQSVVRGPTTHQLWRFAAHVKGLSREFGVCYSCGGSMERGGNLCPHCNRLQEPPINPDTLLEGSEPESRAPVYREISVAAAPPAPAELDPELQEKLRLADEVLKERREQGESTTQLRETLEQEKEAAAREREAAQREREAIAREREAVIREKEAIDRDRLALARDREAARRERELRGQTADRSADAGEKQPAKAKNDTSVWDLSEPDIRSELLGTTATAKKTSAAIDKPSIATSAAKGRSPREGGFLSAKDLADAFKLNHQMALAARERKAHGDDDYSAGDDTPSRYKAIGAGSRRGSRRTGRKLFLVLLLLVWVLAIALVVRPDWRTKAIAYFSKLSRPANATMPIAPGAQPPDRLEESPAATDPAPEGLAPAVVPTDTQPATLPAIPPIPAAAEVVPTPPATAPAIVTAPPIVTVPSPAPIVTPAPVPVTIPAAPPAAVYPTTSAAPPPPQLDAKAQAKVLYHAAMDAEIRNDMAEAARIFEEIQKLPPDAWPSDLEIRLKLAKAQLKQR